jgi:hypothetical protein
MVVRVSPPAALAAGLVAFALAACSGDSTGPSNGLTSQQRDDIGSVTQDEVQTSVAALTPGGALNPFSLAPGQPPACVQPSSTANGDGDAVPDDAIWTFTVPPCTYSLPGGGTVAIRGQIEIADPTPTTADFDYSATLTDFKINYADGSASRSYIVLRNGTRSLTGGVGGLTLTTDLTILRTLATFDVSAHKQWTVTFTPASGSQVEINRPLPSGSITIAGTIDWSRPGETFALAVSTPEALQYDATCTDTPRKITAGELRVTGSFNGKTGYVRLRWRGCGEGPEVKYFTD